MPLKCITWGWLDDSEIAIKAYDVSLITEIHTVGREKWFLQVVL